MSSPTEEIAAGSILQMQASLRNGRNRLVVRLFLLAGLLLGLTFFLDENVIHWVQLHLTLRWEIFFGAVSHFGDWPWLMLYAAPFLIFAALRKRRSLFRLIVVVMIAATLAGAADNAVRLTTGRARPNAKVAPGWYGMRHAGKWIVGKNQFSAFPSAHTAVSFGFFGALALQKRRGSFLWLLPAALIGTSRIAVNAHHLSDVSYGAWIGLFVAYGVWQYSEKWRKTPVLVKTHPTG